MNSLCKHTYVCTFVIFKYDQVFEYSFESSDLIIEDDFDPSPRPTLSSSTLPLADDKNCQVIHLVMILFI